jgi:hypothetical protein
MDVTFIGLPWGEREQSAKPDLFVQHNTQESVVDLNCAATVLNKAQSSEFVHEHIDPGTRRSHHLCQHLLRYFGKHLLRSILLAVACQ